MVSVYSGLCVLDLPNIQQNFAKYRGRGFDVLSASLDDAPDAVRRFRAAKQPVPWAHAWVAGGLANATVRQWDASGVPRVVLVDSKGIVVATDAAVRGAQLDATLARLLAEPGPPTR